MTDGLDAVAAVVFLSMTVLVPVVLGDTVFELLDTVFEEVLTVLPTVVFVVTVSVALAGPVDRTTASAASPILRNMVK